MQLPHKDELIVESLGPAEVASPIGDRDDRLVPDDARVLVCSCPEELGATVPESEDLPVFERAGARRRLFFDPASAGAGIVTCGGLCPGLNDVIRAVVLTLTHTYGISRIHGFRYGYNGLAREPLETPIELDPRRVGDIGHLGGTILGSSRGPQDPAEMVDTLERLGISILFAIGGDGTLRGASVLVDEIARRGAKISVIGIPKTIDNDLQWIFRSFGFSTAVDEAGKAIKRAHAEARGAWNGVGIVKLMGRHAGFIAAHATLSCSEVNFCLIPEVPFRLEGPGGFLEALRHRLAERRHAVVVVAEGAGQEILGADSANKDASGNTKLEDIGVYIRDVVKAQLGDLDGGVSVKYIDPSYLIRGLPANSIDAELCLLLGQHAVHAGMSGRTRMMVGFWNGHFTHVPLGIATAGRRGIDPTGSIWSHVLEVTGQPARMDGSS